METQTGFAFGGFYISTHGLANCSNSQMANPTSHNQVDGESISYLTQAEAAAIDETLMGELGFSIDQLMVRF